MQEVRLKVKKPNIVVTDGYTLNPGDNPWDAVAEYGNLTVYDRLMDDEIVERCREAEILVVNKTQIRETALAEMLSLIHISEPTRLNSTSRMPSSA